MNLLTYLPYVGTLHGVPLRGFDFDLGAALVVVLLALAAAWLIARLVERLDPLA